MTIPQQIELALSHHQAGRLAEAEKLYRQILAAEPNHPDALHLLGLVASAAGQPAAALDLIQRAVHLCPDAVEYRVNLGTVYEQLGRFDEAINVYQTTISLRPELATVHSNLGNALVAKGRTEQAIVSFQKALELQPDFPDALYNLGNVYQDLGQWEDAIVRHRRATSLRPDWVEALNNLGYALSQIGENDQAVPIYLRAISLRPTAAPLHLNLANAYHAQGKLDPAIASLRRAIELQPNYSEAYNALANCLKDSGDASGAVECYRKAVQINPNYVEADSNLIFFQTMCPQFSSRDILRQQRQWNDRHAVQFKKEIAPHSNDRGPNRRLRIGYVSADFRTHVVARNILPMFRDRDRSQFEVFCYANVARPDTMSEIFRKSADTWRDIHRLDDTAAAELIRADRIDILVDLSLHTAGNRLLVFARKPAPVQITFAGYPGGTGLGAIDWRLTDSYLDPPGSDDGNYVERSYRLPGSFWCYDPDAMQWEPDGSPALPFAELPANHNSHITFGCLNNFCKVNDLVLALWSSVLQQTKHSRMLIMAPEGSARQRVLNHFSSCGISANRIEFVSYQPRRKYLSEFNRIDIALDTFPYNGHTASLDAMWMGVPVISRLWNTVVGRAGFSQASNLLLSNVVADSDERFSEIAASLSSDLPELAKTRRTLRDRMLASPLCDARRFASNIEAAYREIWTEWCGS